MNDAYPVTLSVDYPDRPLNRVSTAFRIFAVIPIAIVINGSVTSMNTLAPNPIPEPASAAALLAVAGLARRRR